MGQLRRDEQFDLPVSQFQAASAECALDRARVVFPTHENGVRVYF